MHSYGFDGHLYVEIAVGGLARYEKYILRSTGRVTSNHYQYSYDTFLVRRKAPMNAYKVYTCTHMGLTVISTSKLLLEASQGTKNTLFALLVGLLQTVTNIVMTPFGCAE